MHVKHDVNNFCKTIWSHLKLAFGNKKKNIALKLSVDSKPVKKFNITFSCNLSKLHGNSNLIIWAFWVLVTICSHAYFFLVLVDAIFLFFAGLFRVFSFFVFLGRRESSNVMHESMSTPTSSHPGPGCGLDFDHLLILTNAPHLGTIKGSKWPKTPLYLGPWQKIIYFYIVCLLYRLNISTIC